MTLANSLSVEDLTNELQIGKATTNFILDRFSPWLDSLSKANHEYSPDVIPLLIRIKELLSSGILPSQIEEILENDIKDSTRPTGETESQGNDIRMNQEALSFIRDMVSDIRGHQGRIAKAHEKRAVAEERKAIAIEKRAEAEEKKADAMNNIASALQEMNQLRSADTQAMAEQSIELASHAAQALIKNDTPISELDDDFEDPLAGMEELLDQEPAPLPMDEDTLDEFETDIDDLVQSGEPGLSEEDIDDLSSLINTVSETEDLSNLLEEEIPLPEPDDLSLLVDDPALTDAHVSHDLDDLSSLIENESHTETKMDDLSLLVGTDQAPEPIDEPDDIDDLSALVDSEPKNEVVESGEVPLDNLALLVDPETDKDGNIASSGDDLWSLVDKDEDNIPMDDLSALIDQAPAEPSLKPEITPDQDLAKYKAAVMKIIIKLKSQGLNSTETTARLNADDVPTLSGEPQWRETAIDKIYGYIDTAK